MSKLFSFRSWLSIAEAAQHLSNLFEETVTEKDIFRFALDGKITISVVFPDAPWGELFQEIDEAEIDYLDVPTLDGKETLRLPTKVTRIAPNGAYIQGTGKKVPLEDDYPYELPLIGGEIGDIRQQYWDRAGGEREETISIDGTFVRDGKNYFSLLDDYRASSPAVVVPMGWLPETCVFVVTPKSLATFEDLVTKPPKSDEDRSLSQREETTLLNIIGALLNLINTKESAVISQLLESHPNTQGIKKRTLEEKFAIAKRSLKSG